MAPACWGGRPGSARTSTSEYSSMAGGAICSFCSPVGATGPWPSMPAIGRAATALSAPSASAAAATVAGAGVAATVAAAAGAAVAAEASEPEGALRCSKAHSCSTSLVRCSIIPRYCIMLASVTASPESISDMALGNRHSAK